MRYLGLREGPPILPVMRYRDTAHSTLAGKRKLESDHVYAMILATYVECRWRG